MSVFQWTDDFHTGLELVDQQHRRLVDMLNELDEARTIGNDSRVMLELLDGLTAYTQYHFATEESLMGKPDFDNGEFDRHRAEHQGFIAKVGEVQSAAHHNPTVVSGELMDFLVHWLTGHILGTDKKMAALLGAADGGQPIAGTTVTTDALVQALRESELRFRGLADSVPALIWMADAKGRRSYFNQQWSEFTGLEKAQLPENGWFQCVHPEDLERVRNLHTDPGQRLEKTMAEYRLRRADGRYRWFLESTVPRCHADGGFAGEVGCAFDITERHQVEQLLRGAKQRLESMVQQRTEQLSKANRVLEQRVLEQQALTRELQHTQAQLLQSEKMAGIGQLAAGVAHEINNPIGYIHSNLSVLKGYTEDLFELINTYAGLVNRLPLDDGLRQELEQTKGKLDLDFLRQDIPQLLGESLQGAEQARLIVQNLKDFTGVDRRQAAPFDLEAGLENTLEMLGRDIQADIRREFSHLQPVICVGAQINQVFQQLLDNALKAMEGPGTITVRTGREGSDWVWVEIQDSGRGIPEQHLGRLFDPFFTTRPVGEGTGMGLALAYTIVQQHGGRIDVHSSPGAGARFRLWLPDTAKMNAAPG